MAKGYLIVHVTVTDPKAYKEYAIASSELLGKYGARVFVNPETAVVLEGRGRPRTVIFEFESFERAQEFWNSPEYTKAKALRMGAADGEFILVAGMA